MTDQDPTGPAGIGGTPPRSVFITGGSRGIGRAIAERFAAAGHRVAATYRSGDVPSGVLGVPCDVTDPAQVEAAFTQVEGAHGPVEVLVANAGITRDQLVMRMSEEDWDAVIATNLTGPYRVVRRAVRAMVRARFGRIVLISSVVGQMGGPGQVNYASAKAGLTGMARSLTRELGGRGITANVVAPGFIETDMTAELPEATVEGYRAQIPSGRMGRAQEVAAAVEWLSSDDAGYISGAVIPVDGGLGMGH